VRRRGSRKRATGTRAPSALPQAPDQRWSLDFVSDCLAAARRFRILVVVDELIDRAGRDVVHNAGTPVRLWAAAGLAPLVILATSAAGLLLTFPRRGRSFGAAVALFRPIMRAGQEVHGRRWWSRSKKYMEEGGGQSRHRTVSGL
jgi:hypothetical protein